MAEEVCPKPGPETLPLLNFHSISFEFTWPGGLRLIPLFLLSILTVYSSSFPSGMLSQSCPRGGLLPVVLDPLCLLPQSLRHLATSSQSNTLPCSNSTRFSSDPMSYTSALCGIITMSPPSTLTQTECIPSKQAVGTHAFLCRSFNRQHHFSLVHGHLYFLSGSLFAGSHRQRTS